MQKLFFLFLMDLKQEKEQIERREVEHEANHLQLGLGQQEKAPVPWLL